MPRAAQGVSKDARTAQAAEDHARRRAPIGFDRKQATVVHGIGLRRIGHTVELPDTPATRGMILKVRHLVTVESSRNT